MGDEYTVNGESVSADFIWGSEEIGKAIGRNERQPQLLTKAYAPHNLIMSRHDMNLDIAGKWRAQGSH